MMKPACGNLLFGGGQRHARKIQPLYRHQGATDLIDHGNIDGLLLMHESQPALHQRPDVCFSFVGGHETDTRQIIIKAEGLIGHPAHEAQPSSGILHVNGIHADNDGNGFNKNRHNTSQQIFWNKMNEVE